MPAMSTCLIWQPSKVKAVVEEAEPAAREVRPQQLPSLPLVPVPVAGISEIWTFLGITPNSSSFDRLSSNNHRCLSPSYNN